MKSNSQRDPPPVDLVEEHLNKTPPKKCTKVEPVPSRTGNRTRCLPHQQAPPSWFATGKRTPAENLMWVVGCYVACSKPDVANAGHAASRSGGPQRDSPPAPTKRATIDPYPSRTGNCISRTIMASTYWSAIGEYIPRLNTWFSDVAKWGGWAEQGSCGPCGISRRWTSTRSEVRVRAKREQPER